MSPVHYVSECAASIMNQKKPESTLLPYIHSDMVLVNRWFVHLQMMPVKLLNSSHICNEVNQYDLLYY